jgi:tripartite-type tricarboxylate transporter receptor subunit TctC
MKRVCSTAAIVLSLAFAPGVAAAQTYPTRPVTMIVPFAAGGPTDSLARILAQAMSEALGQQVVLENVPGAGGGLGTTRLIRAQADGYTTLIHDLALPAGPLLNKNLTYDLNRELEPIGLINAGPMVLISRQGLAPDAASLFTSIRKNPDRISLGHSGLGTNSHMCGLLVQQALGVRVTEVPYRGAAPAMNDMLAGQLDIMCEQSTTAIPQIQAQKVVAHGVTSAKRLAALPDVPTLSENSIAGFDFSTWHGLYVPANTPAAVIESLNQALQKALANPNTQSRFAAAGRTEFATDQRSPTAHRNLLSADQKRLKAALESAGLKPAE